MKSLDRRWQRGAAQDGAAVVEMAVVSPLLLLLLFGIIQMGYFMYVRMMMMEAARRGCRAMVVVGKNSTAVDPTSIYSGPYAAQQYLSAFPNSQIFTITATPAPPAPDPSIQPPPPQPANWMIDEIDISTTIGQALQFKMTGVIDPPITARYLMAHEGTVPVP